MGLFGFGGSSGGDTSGASTSSSSSGIGLSTYGSSGDSFASKKRDLDFSSSSSFDPSGSSPSLGVSPGGDVEATIQAEQQKLQLMSAIHKINDICWDTCVDSVGSSLGGRSENCLRNCAERFVDTTLLVTSRFAQLAERMQAGR